MLVSKLSDGVIFFPFSMWSSVKSHTWCVTLCPFPDKTCISLSLWKSIWTEDWNIFFFLWQRACHTYSCLCHSKQDFCNMFCFKRIYKYLLEMEDGWSLSTIALPAFYLFHLAARWNSVSYDIASPLDTTAWETSLFCEKSWWNREL